MLFIFDEAGHAIPCANLHVRHQMPIMKVIRILVFRDGGLWKVCTEFWAWAIY